MNKQILALILGVSSTIAYAESYGDQLLCKNLDFSQSNYRPTVIHDLEFKTIFEQRGDYTLYDEYRADFQYKNRNKKTSLYGLPILWIKTGHERVKGVDRQPIQRIYTRTTFIGDLDNVKNVIENKVGLKFNKHVYQDNKRGKYMYYASRGNVVAMIQTGSGTGQIHVTCGVSDKRIDHLLENGKMFRDVPQQ